MSTTPLDEPTVELDAALERLRRFGGDTLLRDMIDLFLEHTPARIAAAQQAIATGDAHAAHLAVHSMVSSCAQLGAERMRALSLEAEHLVGTDPAAVCRLLDALATELAHVRPVLVAARPSAGAPA